MAARQPRSYGLPGQGLVAAPVRFDVPAGGLQRPQLNPAQGPVAGRGRARKLALAGVARLTHRGGG
jgi:hypothetical protein